MAGHDATTAALRPRGASLASALERVAWLSVAAFSVALLTLSGITFITEPGGG